MPDEGAKQALISAEPRVSFTTRHFDGYPAVLVRIEELDEEGLTELAEEAWACRAPRRLLAEHPSHLGPERHDHLVRRPGGPPRAGGRDGRCYC